MGLLRLRVVQEVTKSSSKNPREPFAWVVTVKEAKSDLQNPAFAAIDNVEFKLHESFIPDTEVITKAPFKLKKAGYGSFDLTIKLHFKNRAFEPAVFVYFLNLDEPRSEKSVDLRLESTVALAKKPLAEATQASTHKNETSKTPNVAKRSRSPSAEREGRIEKKPRPADPKDQNGKGIDLSALFKALHKLEGDDIWAVNEIIKKAKGQEVSATNEPGDEFQFDLTTLEATVLHKLWGICEKSM